jgi:hypothetical protein
MVIPDIRVLQLLKYRYITIFTSIKSFRLAAKSRLDTAQDACEMRFDDLVVGFPACFFAAQEAAPLHEAQVLGRHVAGNFAGRGQFPNGVAPLEKHLHDA